VLNRRAFLGRQRIERDRHWRGAWQDLVGLPEFARHGGARHLSPQREGERPHRAGTDIQDSPPGPKAAIGPAAAPTE